MRRGAVFLDRDNTIVADPGYLHEPARVALLPGAAAGLAALSKAGWPLIVVSNQSGIARGLFGEDAYHAVTRRLADLLAAHDVRLLGTYFCPHHPDVGGACYCRKPAAKLFRDASREHGIDLKRSWYLGDRWRDLAPAVTLGGRGILVNRAPADDDVEAAAEQDFPVVPDLREAARIIGAPDA